MEYNYWIIIYPKNEDIIMSNKFNKIIELFKNIVENVIIIELISFINLFALPTSKNNGIIIIIIKYPK